MDKSVPNFEVYGKTINIEQCKTIKPYPTKNYNFFSHCKVKNESDNVTKTNDAIVKTKKIDKNKQRALVQYNKIKTTNPIVHQRLAKTNNTIRIPMTVKTSLLPPQRTNFYDSEEMPLFANKEEAQQAISRLLGNTGEQVCRPYVSKSVLSHYLEDVYQCLYTRHVEALVNTSVQPLTRKSLHIHNQLLEESSQQTTPAVDVCSKQDHSGESSDEEDLIDAMELVSLEQPIVKMSPLKLVGDVRGT